MTSGESSLAWIGISTSSPRAAAAIILSGGQFVKEWSAEANGRAGAIALSFIRDCEHLIESEGLTLCGLIADVGPGSFTGMRVGITMAKAMALGKSLKLAGISAFDLIGSGEMVAISSRKGSWACRKGREEVFTAEACPEGWSGWGRGLDQCEYPSFRRSAEWWHRLKASDPVSLLPEYFGEPLVSQPKTPFAATVEGPK